MLHAICGVRIVSYRACIYKRMHLLVSSSCELRKEFSCCSSSAKISFVELYCPTRPRSLLHQQIFWAPELDSLTNMGRLTYRFENNDMD